MIIIRAIEKIIYYLHAVCHIDFYCFNSLSKILTDKASSLNCYVFYMSDPQ